MAINPSTNATMAGRVTAADANYPYASSKDESSPGAGDGMPYFKARADDILGLQQGLLKSASIVPSGNADTAVLSQYLQSIVEIASGRAFNYDDSGVANVYVLDIQANQQGPQSYFDGMECLFIATNSNTVASSVDVNGIGAVDIADTAIAGTIVSGARIKLRYNDATGDFDIVSEGAVFAQEIRSITATVSLNILTLGLGATTLSFRDTPIGSGTINARKTAALSLAVPAGAKLGTISAQQSRLVLLAIDNAGIVELAIVNLSGGNNLDETTLITTVAMGTASDLNNVIYSTTARSNVPFRVVGYIDSTQVTAGTWATAPSTIQGAGGNALTAMNSIGYGQTWQDVSGSRVINTTYYNTTGKPIFINATINSSVIDANFEVDGVAITENDSGNIIQAYSFIVPQGSSYLWNSATGTIQKWTELR